MEEGEFMLNNAEVKDKAGELGEKGEGVSPLFSSTSPFFMAVLLQYKAGGITLMSLKCDVVAESGIYLFLTYELHSK